jgi:hypothetical protein
MNQAKQKDLNQKNDTKHLTNRARTIIAGPKEAKKHQFKT